MITVLGTGSWGTALAAVLITNKQSVCLWGRDPEVLKDLSNNKNSKYLPNNPQIFDDLSIVSVYSIISESISNKTEFILVAIPSDNFLDIIVDIKQGLSNHNLLEKNIPIIIASKGLSESAEHQPKWLHQIVAEQLGDNYPVCILSGPSFAQEVANKQPTSVVIAAKNIELSKRVATLFHNEWFRVYTRDDILGVELGGALKNILAFAVGCAEGYGFGCNTRAAIITRGLHEMLKLAEILNVDQETMMGLSGLGDLVLTATDNQSRNKRFGLYIGQGLDIETALSKVGQHVACYQTTKLIYNMVKKYNLDLPIVNQAYKILFENFSIKQAAHNLASRPQKEE